MFSLFNGVSFPIAQFYRKENKFFKMFFLSFRGCFISDGIELLTDQQIVGEIRGTLPGEYEKRTCLSHGVYSHVFAINFNTDKQT